MIIDIEGISYNVIINRKNNKNLYIRVTQDLQIKVSCPYLYPKKIISKILKENEKAIIKMIDSQKKKKNIDDKDMFLGKRINVIYNSVDKALFDGKTLIIKDEDMLNKWYKNTAKSVFKTYLDEAYYVFDEKIPYPKLKIRKMKTRWGVCNKKDDSITLNLDLIKKDHKYLNYVIIHELSHFVHFDHSKLFWKTVEKYCPDYKDVRKELKE